MSRLGAGAGTRFGSGWISGVLGVVFQRTGRRRRAVPALSVVAHHAQRPRLLSARRRALPHLCVPGGRLRPRHAVAAPAAQQGARRERAGAGDADDAAGRISRQGRRARRHARLRGPRLVSAQRARAVADLHPARARVRAPEDAADLPLRLAHRPHPLRGESPAAAGARAAHADPGHRAVRVGGVAGAAADDPGAAAGAAVLRDRRGRRPGRVRGAPRFPHASRGCGGSTPYTIRLRPWTGWPAPACTCSTSWSPGACPSCRSTCSASRPPRSTATWSSSRSTRCSSTPTSASASSPSSGSW